MIFRALANGGAKMKYNVSQLLKEPIGSERVFTIAEGDSDQTLNPVQNAVGPVKLVRTHQGIWTQAWLTVLIDQDCSRCLADSSHSLELEIDEEYLPEIDVKTGHRVTLPADWEGFCISADHTLDLAEAIRQSALSILPLKPLCKPDCIGICDRCGLDRNLHECYCYSENIDPRWAALRSLMVEPQT